MYTPDENRYQTMTYRRCGASGVLLPAISLGLWHNFGDLTPFATQQAMLRTAFDHGIVHFDLANNYGPPYGEAERNFGRHMDVDWHTHRDELFYIPYRTMKRFWDRAEAGGRKSFTYDELDQAWRIFPGAGEPVPFLDLLQKDLNERGE